jgi:SAM-dependent methyltransferase
MSITASDAANAKEIAYWNGAAGRNWTARQESQDILFSRIMTATLERAAVRSGERVVDIGCGTGTSSIELGRLVGPSGCVLGVDVSEPMLTRARERLPPELPVEFAQADATVYCFTPQAFDLLFSRFGVMFFAEPARAFTNLRGALRPGGRLTFACWQKPDANAWLMVPLRAAYEHVPPLPKLAPEDPGPFSFANEDRVRRVLGEAGFQSIGLAPLALELDIARGQGLDAAVAAALDIGPTSRALEGQPPAMREAVAVTLRRALAPYRRGLRVPLAAAIWAVTATNP